jgi:hypothetical protein
MALGLLVATTGTGSGFFPCKILFSHESFELTISLIVSMLAHSWWPWACSKTTTGIDSGIFIVILLFFN